MRYEVYHVPPASCDSEWQRLGEMRADTQAAALEKALLRWPGYAREELVALSAASLALSLASTTVNVARPSNAI